MSNTPNRSNPEKAPASNRRLAAVILAGGRGSRLCSDEFDGPKCLFEVAGKSLLDWVLDYLEGFYPDIVDDFVFCLGYRAGDVGEYLRWMPRSIPFRESYAGCDATMNRRILHALHDANYPERILVLYADEVADVNLRRLLMSHEESGVPATVTVVRRPAGFGIVESSPLEPGRVLNVHSELLVNIGFCILDMTSAPVRMALDATVNCDFENLLRRLARKGLLGFYEHRGFRFTVNTLQDAAEAEKMCREMRRTSDAEKTPVGK